jgi:hypothetical protein
MPQHDDFGFGTAFVSRMLRNRTINGIGGMQHQWVPTAVTIKERIIVLNVQLNQKSISHGFLAGIFGMLDHFGVIVDTSVALGWHRGFEGQAHKAETRMRQGEPYIHVEWAVSLCI